MGSFLKEVAVLVLALLVMIGLTEASLNFPNGWERNEPAAWNQQQQRYAGDIALIHTKNLTFFTVEKVDEDEYCVRPLDHSRYYGTPFINLPETSILQEWMKFLSNNRRSVQFLSTCTSLTEELGISEAEWRQDCSTLKVEEFNKDFTLCYINLGDFGFYGFGVSICYDGPDACF